MLLDTMDDNITSNKRIAKNTILLYARMLLILIVSLYTSRIVLYALGVVDFGIYNVVAGFVTMFSFINTSMATSTQRYLTYNIGKGNIYETKTIFANSIRVHLIIGAIIFILCECLGVWIINNKLSIPPEKIIAANWVFQLALIQFLINISQVPYNACIIAHEKILLNIYD